MPCSVGANSRRFYILQLALEGPTLRLLLQLTFRWAQGTWTGPRPSECPPSCRPWCAAVSRASDLLWATDVREGRVGVWKLKLRLEHALLADHHVTRFFPERVTSVQGSSNHHARLRGREADLAVWTSYSRKGGHVSCRLKEQMPSELRALFERLEHWQQRPQNSHLFTSAVFALHYLFTDVPFTMFSN